MNANTAINAETRLRWNTSPWFVVSIVITLFMLVPILTICGYLFAPASENWEHLSNTVLYDYITNSLILMAGVALGAGSIGTTAAWFTSMYRFPGRKWLIWALLLPLSIPAYIIAYTYTGLLDVSGPVQEWIRVTLDVQYGGYWFPEIRSIGGAIAMFSLVLYPYVYLLARAAFLNQSICVLDASRTLGCNPWAKLLSSGFAFSSPCHSHWAIAGFDGDTGGLWYCAVFRASVPSPQGFSVPGSGCMIRFQLPSYPPC